MRTIPLYPSHLNHAASAHSYSTSSHRSPDLYRDKPRTELVPTLTRIAGSLTNVKIGISQTGSLEWCRFRFFPFFVFFRFFCFLRFLPFPFYPFLAAFFSGSDFFLFSVFFRFFFHFIKKKKRDRSLEPFVKPREEKRAVCPMDKSSVNLSPGMASPRCICQ